LRSGGEGTQPPRIVIVGHGMVGHRLCRELRKLLPPERAEIVVFSGEEGAPYDRVHLSRIVRGERPEVLDLADASWFEESRIVVKSGDPVVRIDRGEQLVHASSGLSVRYDHLVLCTGAAAVELKAVKSPLVTVLRTRDDALIVRERALAVAARDLPVVIIGGGLLGLELATDLTSLRLEVDVVEGAEYPLSRQLERTAGSALLSSLERPGLRLHFGSRVAGVEVSGDERVSVALQDGRSVTGGLVVLAMGIRARDELARQAGLSCDLFGGVIVDDRLLTRDPRISAIGECARHRGTVYGIVAPGYAMAEQVARRLAGQNGRFEGVATGTRLKVPGVDLSVLGESSATGLGVQSIVYEAEGTYRRLAVRKGRIIGITSLGEWGELGRAQDALSRGEKLKQQQLECFKQCERVWPERKVSLRTWPSDALVCTCMGVTCGTLKALVAEGASTVEELSQRSSAGTVCGTCRPLLSTLTESPEPEVQSSRTGAWISLAAILGAVSYVVLPSWPVPTSVQGWSIDQLWASKAIKQATGFSLLALFTSSLLLSLRKRSKWLKFGSFEAWKVAHAAVGVACLVIAFLHTGLRLGQGTDRALVLVFLGSTLLGGATGGWALLLPNLPAEWEQTVRSYLVRSHIYLLWPLPVLVLFHLIKVYWF